MNLHDASEHAVREPPQPSVGGQALTSLWRFMWAITKPHDVDEVRALLMQIPDEDVRRDILSAAHLFWEDGRHEGMRFVLEGLLRQRFQSLPEQALAAIKNASIGELEQMATQALTARSLAEILPKY